MVALPSIRALAAFATLGAVAGCTTLGTNVSGDFDCRAQEGRCAMTQTIDDEALAKIAADDAMPLTPAGPYLLDDGVTPLSSPSVIARDGNPAAYEIAVSFPGHGDEWGGEVAAREVRTLALLPGRNQLLDQVERRAGDQGPEGLLAAAQAAPSLLALTAMSQAGRSGTPPAPAAAGSSPVERIRAEVEEVLGRPSENVRSAGVFPNGGQE